MDYIFDSLRGVRALKKWIMDQAQTWFRQIYLYYTNQPNEVMDKARTAAFQRTLENYRFDSITGRLLHRIGNLWTISIIREEVSPILADTHDKMGHFSSKMILDKLRYRVYWPKMAEDVRDYVKGCIACAQWAQGRRSQLLNPVVSSKPFDLIGMDFIGPFTITKSGNQYVLNIVSGSCQTAQGCILLSTDVLPRKHSSIYNHPSSILYINYNIHNHVQTLYSNFHHFAKGAIRSVRIRPRATTSPAVMIL